MTTKEIMAHMSAELQEIYDEREVQALVNIAIEEVLHYSKVDVVLRGDFEQDKVFVERMMTITHKLKAHEPIQYILGKANFHGHEFKVTPATLIPRPETEQLVDMIVDENKANDLNVLDLGTGSGCIAISLARALKFAEVTAIDFSQQALIIAQENALKLKAKVNFEQKDMLTMQPDKAKWDIIVSNPPYVCESEKASMEQHVLAHEPSSALFVSDNNPLIFYKAIAKYAGKSLIQGGKLYLEINQKFGKDIKTLLENYNFDAVRIINDQYGKVRFAIGSLSN